MFKMHIPLSTALLSSIALLAASVTAAPAAAAAPELSRRSCSVEFPSSTLRLSEDRPSVASGQTLEIRALQYEGGQHREETEIGFTDIPEGSWGCQLELFFPPSPSPPRGNQPPVIRADGASRVNVWALDRDVTPQDTWASSPNKSYLLGSTEIQLAGDNAEGTTIRINSLECKPNMSFRVGIAGASEYGFLGFWQQNPPSTQPAGFRLTHNC